MKTIKLNNEEYVSKEDYNAEINKIKKQKNIKTIAGSGIEIPFEIGNKYFFRTVTYFALGEVVGITGNFLTLKDASWIADTGRFMNAIDSGVLNEVEPVKVPMYININSITDSFDWIHELPRVQK